ncbi:MAG: Rieske 2Fe-2S domain-containing protein [Rubrobacter sp.]|nr:Rieske 2Fe-2S domain-containing protein [Rubrobacter sp.]
MTETKTEKRHVVCREGELAQGEIRPFNVGGRRLAVARLDDGSYRAMSDVCPHQGASMGRGAVERMWTSEEPGEMCRDSERSVAICPRHNFEFDVDSGLSPNVSPRLKIKTYEARAENGEVIVYL